MSEDTKLLLEAIVPAVAVVAIWVMFMLAPAGWWLP